MKESDWKLFKEIKDKAIDQYCQTALLEFGGIIDNENQSAHERICIFTK